MSTGAAAVAALDIHIFNFRQSSEAEHVDGGTVASRMPGSHRPTGCGAFHLRLPRGGVAYGIPRNAHDAPRSLPNTVPACVVTTHEVGATARLASTGSKSPE